MTGLLHAAPPARLADDGVVLRAMTEDDWVLEQALSRDPEVLRWTTHPPHLDEAAARQRMLDVADRAHRRLGQRYAVRPVEGGVEGPAVGMAALTVERSPEPSVGYALLPAGRGRGLAVAAVRLMTDWLLSVGHPCVRLGMLPDNEASAAVAARAGYRDLGVQAAPRPDGSVGRVRWWERRA
ncbi:GNAT family N-acetyltransferase [Modestobacter roseus]|uniref:RimJ/RimL family protein N-acetyltransferase n=1 Tax=Modestobacter roseus TaxID=1181884 RepID=A0A562ILA3_9ACTN|nr:GNAT family N-acetyltransferase [Modestobacter roseus]MQA32305.1 GNAT family N-acetyltransferase [Modestobacter roseus]TWH71801.1 RimJ/RimL family protein N-acetyltransferase [Modestobacter roseus]